MARLISVRSVITVMKELLIHISIKIINYSISVLGVTHVQTVLNLSAQMALFNQRKARFLVSLVQLDIIVQISQ